MSLTPAELTALDKLTEAIDAIRALPSCHPSDWEETVPHIHAIQEKVMARSAVRAHLDLFRHVDGFE